MTAAAGVYAWTALWGSIAFAMMAGLVQIVRFRTCGEVAKNTGLLWRSCYDLVRQLDHTVMHELQQSN